MNTNAEPDLSGPATAVTVTRTNTPDTTDAPVPAALNLRIASGTNSVTVSWDKPDATGLTWQRKQNHNGGGYDANWTDIEADAITETTEGGVIRLNFTLTAASGTYSFKIRAKDSYDNFGEEGETETVTAGAPGPPTALAVATEDDGTTPDVDESPTQTTLHLSCTAPAEGTITRYE